MAAATMEALGAASKAENPRLEGGEGMNVELSSERFTIFRVAPTK